MPHSTLGYERRFNWAFKTSGEEEFVAAVLAGQPDPPKYFAEMKRLNQAGTRVLGGLALPPRLEDDALAALASRALVIDTRSAEEFAQRFVPGTLNLPINASFVTWAGWLIPYTDNFYLILGEGAEARLPEVVRALALIGLDRIGGYFRAPAIARALSAQAAGQIAQLSPQDLAGMRGDETPVVIDVRHANEWREGRLPSAIHIPLGHLANRLTDIPKGRPLVTQCQGGARSAIAASLLHRAGFTDVRNLLGGYAAWQAAGLPTTAAE
ncbi:MAG TPA: rhodanese-like domain-containing protein [Vicinamibacterales bacterium]|nr:rhodanese-like domain-containing protein [Vicinamibacterales bacterium]